ncbi:MAG: hypothetical protein OHK0046_15060 [Anaerolineae bacterium]
MAWEIGAEVGQYRLTEHIANGGMATIFKAYQPRLDRHVAIKVMHEMFTADETFQARFEREARVVAALDHPNIVPVYDFAEYLGRPYLVMKFIEGLTLKALLEKTSLSPQEVLQLITPVGDALNYAHEQGIVHRDMKPSNILLDRRGTPYITDFGLARMLRSGDSTLSGTMLGTAYYISPEQASIQKVELDGRTDVYSLGVILYELVVGRVPFDDASQPVVLRHHLETPPPLPRQLNSDVSEAVEAVLLKALAKNRDERYSTTIALVDAYRKAINAPAPQFEETPGWLSNDEDARPATPRRPLKASTPFARGSVPNDSSFVKHANTEEIAAVATEPPSSEASLRDMVEKRVMAQQQAFWGLVINFITFLLINVWLFGLGEWLSAFFSGGDPGLPSVITMFWGLALVIQAINYYREHGPGASRRARLVERELERERRLIYGGEKPKNDFTQRSYRLTDDGELSETLIDLDEQQTKRER